MSFRHLEAVWTRLPGPVSRKIVACYLAARARDDADPDYDGQCWPSYKTIAMHTGVSTREAKRAVRSLILSGVVTLMTRGGVTRGTNGRFRSVSNTYRVNLLVLESMPDLAHVDNRGGGDTMSPRGCHHVTTSKAGGGDTMSPESTRESSEDLNSDSLSLKKKDQGERESARGVLVELFGERARQ